MNKINPNEIHVWRSDLSGVLVAEGILSPEEVDRGRRFVRQEHRRRFLQAKIHLRKILASYLNRAPERIEFQRGVHGKPYMSDNPLGLQFNISHSQDCALIALTLGHEIGVDVEWIDLRLEILPLVQRFFTEEEKKIILELSEPDRPAAFYHYWTRKEAYLKALGVGLNGLSQLSFEEVERKAESLNLSPGFAGAVVLLTQEPRKEDYEIHFFEYNH